MGENVDVKALTARFRQTGMHATGGGGGSPRLPPPILERGARSPVDPGANGSVRPRFPVPLNKPTPGPISPSNGPRFGQAPRGVFPRPPPSHRPNHQEPVRPPIVEADKPGSFRNPTEKLVRPLPKPQDSPGSRGPQTIHTTPLLSQRSMSAEVAPLLRPLPVVGSRPKKPKRPPFVNLEQFRRNPGTPKATARLSERSFGDGNSPTTPRSAGVKMPPLLPNRPKTLTVSASNQDMDDDQDTYDDIDALPPPPPPPSTQTHEGFSPSPSRAAGISSLPLMSSKPSSMTKSLSVQDLDDDQDPYDDIDGLPPPPPPPPTQSQDSWNDSSQADEWDNSDDSEIYEEVDTQDSIPVPSDKDKHSKKDMKRQKEQEKKEQKEREKRDLANRKKFKLTGNETALHIARVREDWHGGKNDLSVQQGESVEIIRTDSNPEGRWLARTMDGTYGYISTKCVDMDYEEVKRRFGSIRPKPDPGVYDDVNSMEGYGCEDDSFPPPPPEVGIRPDPKMLKKNEKEEREFRKKFKFEGPIQVLKYMRVDPNANIKKASGKDLSVGRGDLLDVIQFIGDKKALCRNAQGKYGYVPMIYLLTEEGEIYDDIDHPGDVYDNDNNM